MAINYGVDKVRFPAPVRVGSRVRGGGELVKVETLNDLAILVKDKLA